MIPFDHPETTENDYLTLAPEPAEAEEERLDYNKTVLYELMARPKYMRCYQDAAKVLFASLGIDRPNKANRTAMEHLLFNLAITYRDHPGYAIRYYRSKDFWPVKDESVNPYGIGFKIVALIDQMAEAGYLLSLPGFHTPFKSRMARIWPTEKLIDFIFTPHHLEGCPVEYHEAYAYVRVNDERGCYSAPLSAQTEAMIGMLAQYNSLISQTCLTGISNDGVRIWGSRPVYRVFNNAELTWGGRFYGGWPQNIKSHLRSEIQINGESTVELDYKSQHPYMLYGEFLGEHYSDIFGADDSPYTVENQNGIAYPRALIKSLFLVSLNAESFSAAWQAIRLKYYDDKRTAESSQDYEKLDELELIRPYVCKKAAFKVVYKDFIKKHHRIEGYICTGIGRELQCLDSKIAEYVLTHMTDKGIATLCIHDSFVVQEQHEQTLKAVMEEAYYALKMEMSVPPIEKKEREMYVQATGGEERPHLVGHNSDVFMWSNA